jgi:hypothetical protein
MMTQGGAASEIPIPASLESLPGMAEALAEFRRRIPHSGNDLEPPANQMAADATGSVVVTVNAQGEVMDVEFDHSWRHWLDGEGLPAAVFEAYTAARGLAIEAFAVAAVAAADAGKELPRLSPRAILDRLLEPPADPEEWLVWVDEQSDRIAFELDQPAMISGLEEREQSGRYGYLAATLRGDCIVGLVGDPGRIWNADAGQLRDDALDVLSVARESRDG